ncbi:MAG TPA: flagellar export protein FliJ [Chloroflexi bacterium]|jgi:flagellar FliJ protein|nr:flagellar export protein FliJ [Chloroflexota bacterium]
MPQIPFSLQPVLSYRESLVDMRTRELAHLERQRREAQERLDVLRRAQRETWAVLQDRRVGRVNMTEIQLYMRYLDRLRGAIHEVRAHLADLDRRIEAKRHELLKAVEDKKIMEKLRDKARQRFLETLERNDADFQDEMALIQYVRNGSAAKEVWI